MGHQWADFQILWALVGGGAQHPGKKTLYNAVKLRLRQWIIDRWDKGIVVMRTMVISRGGINSAQICTQSCTQRGSSLQRSRLQPARPSLSLMSNMCSSVTVPDN